MYSKYLDYTEAAVKANHLAQVESEHKDILIGQLKTDLYELKQIEGDYIKLTSLIQAVDQKYALLLDEKNRCQKEQRIKYEIDQGNVVSLKEEIDILRVQIQKICLHIQELIRENTLKKRMNDARLNEVQQISMDIKAIQNKNHRSNEENRGLAITLKNLKDERKRLEQECDGLSALLDSNISKLKNLEKAVRNNESVNARLDKTLHQAENDHSKLILELKQKNEDAKRAEQKLKGLSHQINEAKISYNNVVAQAEKNKAESGQNAANLSNEIAKGKDLTNKIGAVEVNIRSQENELDQIINQEEKERRNNFIALDQSKQLNGELDRLLSLINEYELINKELLDQIEIYSDQDQQAISILNRRAEMKDTIESTLRKVALTGEHIRHIKY